MHEPIALFDCFGQLFGERLVIEEIHQPAVLAMPDDFLDRRGSGGNHHAAGGHRLEQRP